jgi:phosphatidylglycerol---prolipoprotein diacylglyceryl transferase
MDALVFCFVAGLVSLYRKGKALHRFILEIGWFKIASYGLMVAVGMIIGVLIASVRAKSLGENPAVIFDITIWVVVAGLIGARFFYIYIEGWHEAISKPFTQTAIDFLKIREGGLSLLGALITGIPVGLIYLKKKKLNVWKIADITAPSIAIGIAFARIGCFLNGCCFGKPCPPKAFYGIEFPMDSIPYEHYMGILPLYPTQLICALNALLIFIVLSIWIKYRKYDGQIFWLFVLIYGIARFMEDFLRGDSDQTFFGGLFFGVLTLAQTISISGIILSAIMLVILAKHRRIIKNGV